MKNETPKWFRKKRPKKPKCTTPDSLRCECYLCDGTWEDFEMQEFLRLYGQPSAT